MLDNGLCNDAERAYLEALRKLHASTAGTGLGIDCADGPFGPLTIIGGRIYMEEGRLVQTIDSRFPTCTDGDKLAAQITAALGSGAQLQDVDAAEPFYIARHNIFCHLSLPADTHLVMHRLHKTPRMSRPHHSG